MEGRVLFGERRDQKLVQERRRSNKVFGLTSAEKWSGAKQLIDFLDDIFITDRSTFSKFTKPVSSVCINKLDGKITFQAPICCV
jgi:hypothetical protein